MSTSEHTSKQTCFLGFPIGFANGARSWYWVFVARLKRPLFLIFLIPLVAGCGELKKLVLPPSFAIETPPNILQISPGESSTIQVRLKAVNDYTGEVSLEAKPLDINYPGLDIEPSSFSTPVGGSSTIALKIAKNTVPQGVYQVNLKASDGKTSQTAQVHIRVSAPGQSGIERLNQYRAASKLNPVVENAALAASCWLHGRYQVLNFFVGHVEDANLPGFTPEGAACAARSNVGIGRVGINDGEAVDFFMDAPFHAMGMLDPGLYAAGIGIYREKPSGQKAMAGIGIDVSSRSRTGFLQPVFFPGNGATVDLTGFDGEWPNPVAMCGYKIGSGLPLFIMTGRDTETTVEEAKLLKQGQLVESCAYGSTQFVDPVSEPGQYPGGLITATERGKSSLKSRGGAVLVPKLPLQSGASYLVQMTINAKPYEWSFKVSNQPQIQNLQKQIR